MTVPVKTAKKPNKDNGTIRRKVLAMVEASSCRLTSDELRKRFFGTNVVDEKALKTAISDLISSRELKYSYRFVQNLGIKSRSFVAFLQHKLLSAFHCRRPCPVKSGSHLTGVNGNGKTIQRCVLCASSGSAKGR